MVKSIYLQDGEEIFVDDEDYEQISQYTWTKYFKNNKRYIQNNNNKTLTSLIKKGYTQVLKNNDFTKSNLTKSKTMTPEKNWKKLKIDKNTGEWYAEVRVYLNCSDEETALDIYDEKVEFYLKNDDSIYRYNNRNEKVLKRYKSSKVSHHVRNKTGYKGLIHTPSGNYAVYFNFKKKKYYLGTFSKKEKAALVHNKCSIFLHGDKAVLNDVPMNKGLQDFKNDWHIPAKIIALKKGDSNE